MFLCLFAVILIDNFIHNGNFPSIPVKNLQDKGQIFLT